MEVSMELLVTFWSFEYLSRFWSLFSWIVILFLNLHTYLGLFMSTYDELTLKLFSDSLRLNFELAVLLASKANVVVSRDDVKKSQDFLNLKRLFSLINVSIKGYNKILFAFTLFLMSSSLFFAFFLFLV